MFKENDQPASKTLPELGTFKDSYDGLDLTNLTIKNISDS